MDDSDYECGVVITSYITFVASWIYCIAEYGFLLGGGLGWLPSLILANIVGLLWPIVLGLIGLLVLFVLYVLFI